MSEKQIERLNRALELTRERGWTYDAEGDCPECYSNAVTDIRGVSWCKRCACAWRYTDDGGIEYLEGEK